MWQYLSSSRSSGPAPATPTPPSSSASSSTAVSADSSSAWSRISSFLYEKTADAAFQLPPVEDNLAFLRTSAVLAELSLLVYKPHAEVQPTSYVELPLLGNLQTRANVACKLLHFRDVSQNQSLQLPQQFGIWQVEGLGIVIAFRGTSSTNDMLIDINVKPMPLPTEAGSLQDTKVHSGFWLGASQHVADITRIVRQQNSRARHRLPVWITGHSLGGGYANCMVLHLLANKRTKDLFSAGGGSVTFGAPMVLYSEDPARMYSQLQHLQEVAQGRGAAKQLQFHNIVNNADVVPRALGCSLNCIHQALEAYLPSLSMVRETSQHYLPFALYHFIHGVSIRSLRLQPGASANNSDVNHAAYAEQVCDHLHPKHLAKIAWLTSGQAGGLSDHKLGAYQQKIRAHMDQIALDHPQNRIEQCMQCEHSDVPLTQLFDIVSAGQQPPSVATLALDQLAKVAGGSVKDAWSGWAPQVGSSVVSAATSRWQTYWQANNSTSSY